MWLPVINRFIPGSGITFLNVDDVQFKWWAIFRDDAAAIVESLKEQSRGK